MSAKIHKRAKRRDYAGDAWKLRMARAFLREGHRELAGTGAVQVKARLRSLLKSVDGAIRHAEGHAGRAP